MESYFELLPIYTLLIFIAITFLFSFWDKVSDFKGNLSFLQQHFKNTFVLPLLPFTLTFITILELIAGVLALLGMFYVKNSIYYAVASCLVSLLVLFIFLVGQRIAKDFDGAMKITVYIIPVVFCLYLLTN